MVYLVKFEADVQGLASVVRVNGEMYVYAKDTSTARHYMDAYIKDSYSESYAIMSVVPVYVANLEAAGK